MASKARLHWFWRGLIAALAGMIGYVLIFTVVNAVLRSSGLPSSGGVTYVAVPAILLLLPLPGIVTYGLLTRRFGPPAPDGEPHCRKCDHILRGLSEPRCPECGEPI